VDRGWGDQGKREPQTILEHNITLERERKVKVAGESGGWCEDRLFLEGDKLEVAVKTAAGCSRTCQWARDRRRNWSDAIFRTTETALHPMPRGVRHASMNGAIFLGVEYLGSRLGAGVIGDDAHAQRGGASRTYSSCSPSGRAECKRELKQGLTSAAGSGAP
jgi:hypothetical protein